MDNEQIGYAIRRRREQLGMTQEYLAELTGKDQRAVSEYENGKRRLAAIDLPAFAQALDISLLYFFADELTTSDFDAEMQRHLAKLLTDDARRTAINLVRLYADSLQRHLDTKKG